MIEDLRAARRVLLVPAMIIESICFLAALCYLTGHGHQLDDELIDVALATWRPRASC